MEEQIKTQNSVGVEQEQEQERAEQNVVQFLDSMDSYLTLLDSLSSTLRQGWLELAGARHSMGASRVNSALLDLKSHSASTSLQVTQHDVDSMVRQPHFKLCKWASSENGNCCPGEENFRDDKLQTKSDSQQLRHRNTSQISETLEKSPSRNGASLIVDDQVQKERSKSLSMFGTLVSPKLRTAQLSFETALETLIEIANMRSSILSTFDQVQKELEGTKG